MSRQAYRSDEFYPERLEMACTAMQVSHEHLASLAGISLEEIEWFCAGMSKPNLEQLDIIARVTGFEVGFFCRKPDPSWPRIEQTSLRFH